VVEIDLPKGIIDITRKGSYMQTSKEFLQNLINAGVHFGHPTTRWNPKMSIYIWGQKDNIHLINVLKTAIQLEKAMKFLEQVTAEGKPILWVGTKKPAQNIVKSTAESFSHPYVTHRWIGGTLNNFSQVKKSVTKLLHLEDVLEKSEELDYTKKELSKFQKLVEKLKKNVGGITKLTLPIGALVVVDARKEQAAIKEAAREGIPVVGIVDTNTDPSLVDYVIPANDDSAKSIKVIFEKLADAVAKGQEKAKELKAKQEEEKKKAQAEKAKSKKEEEPSEKKETKKVDTEKKAVSKEKSSEKEASSESKAKSVKKAEKSEKKEDKKAKSK